MKKTLVSRRILNHSSIKLKQHPIWKNPINEELWESNWNKSGFMCNIMNAKTMDVGGGIPHQDSFDIHFGSVIYLNKGDECQGGTRLYSYFGKQSFPRPDMITEDCVAIGHEFNQITKNRWLRQWVDEDPQSPWNVELEFEMVYNRCILYEASTYCIVNGILKVCLPTMTEWHKCYSCK